MTVQDLIDRIESYSKGFEFTLPYYKMTEKQKRDMLKVMEVAKEKGLVESISIGAGWDEDGSFNLFQTETYRRV